MHDWWLQLVASAFGKIGHIDEPTILYRQHGENSIGAKNVRKLSYKLKRFINSSEIRHAIEITYDQAESLILLFDKLLCDKKNQIALQYCQIPKMNKLNRWRTICKLKTFKIGLTRNIAYFIFV